MNKSDVVRHVAEETGLSRSAAGAAVNSMLSCVTDSLARGQAVSLLGFGTFGARSRPARTGRNPGTGESLEIAASTAPTFRAGKPLRDAVKAAGGS
jgi:DNA-binding protein HU-beta